MRLSICALCTLGLALVISACGPGPAGGDDAGGPDAAGDACTGNVTRCLGTDYQTCTNGHFQTTQSCPNACSDALGGCVDCDPAAGNACMGNSVVACNANGTYGNVIQDCGSGATCAGGSCSRACTADGVDLIYVVDQNYDFLSFDPRKLGTCGTNPTCAFTPIATPLNGPASSTAVPGWLGGVTPFSMSVDRMGKAWVLYTSGEVFNVDLTTGACTPTTFQPQQQNGAWELFGMGYSTDSSTGDAEKLWIAGGASNPAPGGKFAYIDPSSLAIQNQGQLSNVGENSPELSGTGDGHLFGYFPGATAFVQEIQKTNPGAGTVIGPQMAACSVATPVMSWAFAQWGGKFYIFVTGGDGNSKVCRTDRMTGNDEGAVLQNLPYQIVGAGVSTCAPVTIP